MPLIKLTRNDRSALENFAASTEQAAALRRALALLWLDEGDEIGEVADRFRVSRQTVYNWVQRFLERSHCALQERLIDGARSGRPATAQGIIDPLLEAILDDDPRAWGYPATVWTAPLLQQFLQRAHGLEVSVQSVRLAIERLDVCWKRPRHRLAQRPKTWHQAKGGYNAACGAVCAPYC